MSTQSFVLILERFVSPRTLDIKHSWICFMYPCVGINATLMASLMSSLRSHLCPPEKRQRWNNCCILTTLKSAQLWPKNNCGPDEPFSLNHGTRQGCCLLFALALEPLAIATRASPQISGISGAASECTIGFYTEPRYPETQNLFLNSTIWIWLIGLRVW